MKYVQHDQRYFAMLNCAAVVAKNPRLEGGNTTKAIAYYRYLLDLEMPADCPSSLLSPSPHLKTVSAAIWRLDRINAFIETRFATLPKDNDDHVDKETIDRDRATLVDLIKACTSESIACYLPVGWRSKHDAHFAVLKCRQLKNGHYALSILNHGGGMQFHAPAPKSGYKTRRLYQSDECELEIDSLEGKECLHRLIELSYKYHKDKDEKLNPYSEHDLYAILKLYGTQLPLKDKVDQKVVTTQISGTCTITNLDTAGRDVLVDLGADLKARKRYHFVMKLRSILHAYEAYQRGDCEPAVLDWALEEFAVRVTKEFRHILTDEELAYCKKLHDNITARLQADEKNQITTQCQAFALPNFSSDAPEKYNDLSITPVEQESLYHDETRKDDKSAPSRIPNLPLTPENIVRLLEFKAESQGTTATVPQDVYALLLSLPHCSGQDRDDFWDRVPEQDIPTIIQKLGEICQWLRPYEGAWNPFQHPRALSMALMMYDIAAQLIQRTPEYTLGLDHIYDELNTYIEPESYYIIKRIAKNFETRAQGRKRVFTDSVDYKNGDYDSTVHYVVNVLLNEEQRNLLLSEYKMKDFNQRQLFISINRCINIESTKKIIGPTVIALLRLSGTTHQKGKFCESYEPEQKGVYSFKESNSAFHRELARQDDTSFYTTISRFFPKTIQNQNSIAMQDFSEKTVYTPKEKLAQLKNTARKSPYQLQLSGSIKPDAQPWPQDKKENLHLLAELDEKLRQLECTPHLQIAATLAWLSKNPEKLIYSQVRERLDSLLFGYGHLDSALSHHFEQTLSQISMCLSRLIHHIQEESPSAEALIWICTLASDLRYFVEYSAKIYQIPTQALALPDIKDVLLSALEKAENDRGRATIANELIKYHRHHHTMTPHDSATLLLSQILLETGGVYVHHDESIWAILQPLLQVSIQNDPEKFSPIFNTLLKKYFGIDLEGTWKIFNNQLLNEQTEYVIDLNKGVLRKGAYRHFMDCTQSIINNSENVEKFKKAGIDTKHLRFYQVSEMRAVCSDPRWVFTVDSSRPTISYIQQSMNIGGVSYDFTLITHDGTRCEKVPFENKKIFGRYYQYWGCNQDYDQKEGRDTTYVVKYLATGELYFHNQINKQLTLIKQDEHGVWQPTNTVMLNLIEPQTPQDLAWANFLQPMFGLHNIRCIATITEDPHGSKPQCTVQRIEHLSMGLSFTVKDGRLIWDQDPHYHLVPVHSIPALNGHPGVVILANEQGNRKCLISTFAFKPGEENNALNYQDITDYTQFCDPSFPYFECTLDSKEELTTSSIEGNLYLALYYRNIGDFKRAMKYLDRCKTYQNITPVLSQMAGQVLSRKMTSPLGCAFDLKLHMYLHEHLQKWTAAQQEIRLPAGWHEWIVKTQLPFYLNTISAYKQDVSILPSYARLSDEALSTFFGQKPAKEVYANAYQSNVPAPAERLQKVSVLPGKVLYQDGGASWEKYAKELSLRCGPYAQSYASETWRITHEKHFAEIGSLYLHAFFKDFLADAISQDPKRVVHCRRQLYAALMNDKQSYDSLYTVVSILLFASHHPEYFRDFVMPETNDKALLNAGLVLSKHADELRGKKYMLVDLNSSVQDLSARHVLPADFVPKTVRFVFKGAALEAMMKEPLGELREKYFVRAVKNVKSGDFALSAGDIDLNNPIEVKLYIQYRSGHQENTRKPMFVYQTREKDTFLQLKTDLQQMKKEDENFVTSQSESLVRMANSIPFGVPHAAMNTLLLSRASEQHEIITIEDLFTAFLSQDPNILTHKNPFLTQDDIEAIFGVLGDYALVSARVGQIDSILSEHQDVQTFAELSPYELQTLAATLDKTRAYSLAQYPEFLVYEYATNRLLREDQVKALKDIIQIIEADPQNEKSLHQALLQFAAGGGKTSIIIPILAHRFARKGYLPVIFNTNELYGTSRQDLNSNLSASLGQFMEVVERNLEHQWTKEELQKLLADLQLWRKDKKCILLKPITWHSINIARKLAYFKSDTGIAQAADAVLAFFKTQCVKLEDESQITSDPLQLSIKTYDRPIKVPDSELKLIMRFYDHLMGYEATSHDIAELAGMKSGQKKLISPMNLKRLQKRLVEVIITEPMFAGCDKHALIAYLISESRARPAWLRKVYTSDPATADLIVLARAFIQSHLPHILSKQDYKDFGTSTHSGDYTAAPKHEGKDVSSHFADHTLVVALATQMYERRGLSPLHVNLLLNKLIEEHIAECKWNHNRNVPTEAESWLAAIIGPMTQPSYRFKSMRHLNDALKTALAADPRFCKHPLVVKKFLKQFALPQIEVPPSRVTSGAAELQAGFHRSLLFTATPGLPEIYPATLPQANCYLETAFEAEVIQTLLSPENSRHCKLADVESPTEFFASLPPDILANMTTLMDRGALLTDFNPQEVIASYLGLDARYARPTTTGVFFSKEDTHLQMKDKDIINIPGTALIKALKDRGIKPEKFLLFLFMDLSKTTGIDIKRPSTDVAGLTVGKEQTVTQTIQAAMRERQLLHDNAQTVTWIMFKSLYKEINPKAKDDTFDPKQIIYWMLKNEAKELHTKLIARAYQGIAHEITAYAWELWRIEPKIFSEKYKIALQETQSIQPWLIYELESVQENSGKVLTQYRNELLNKFGFDTKHPAIPKETLARINLIIEQTSALIKKLVTPPAADMNHEVLQEMRQQAVEKNQQEMQQALKSNIDTDADFVFNLETLDCRTPAEIFQNPDLKPFILPDIKLKGVPDLLFCQKNFLVVERPANAPFDHYEPVNLILAKILPDKTVQYLACTAAEAEYYTVLLENHRFGASDPCYAFIDADGDVLTTSNNTSFERATTELHTDNTDMVLAYANLLSGRINDPVALARLIRSRGWSKAEYEALAQKVMSMQVSRCQTKLIDNGPLYRLCGFNGQPAPDLNAIAPATPLPALPMESLHPPAVLTKDPGVIETTPIQFKRILDGYIFGITPIPADLPLSAQPAQRHDIKI